MMMMMMMMGETPGITTPTSWPPSLPQPYVISLWQKNSKRMWRRVGTRRDGVGPAAGLFWLCVAICQCV
jgi:hypothetical protein